MNAWWRTRRAQRKAARDRLWRREDMTYTVGLILAASKDDINRAIADFERQIQATRADTE